MKDLPGPIKTFFLSINIFYYDRIISGVAVIPPPNHVIPKQTLPLSVNGAAPQPGL